MKSFWITTILSGLAGFWMPFAPAAEVQYVQLGSAVTLDCNISCLYDTTWFKHNPDLTPTVVLAATLREGQPVEGFQLSPRFSLSLKNRSLALRITGVKERDLGLYYCIANVNTHLTIGRGTVLQVSSPVSSWFLLHHWYCMVVGIGLLIMVLAVCITHWKTKSNKQTINEIPSSNSTQKDNTTANNTKTPTAADVMDPFYSRNLNLSW